MEGSGLRWRGAISGRGKRSQVEGSGLMWRGAVRGEGKRSLVEGSGLRWRGAIAGGGELRRRGGISGGGDKSLEEGSNRCCIGCRIFYNSKLANSMLLMQRRWNLLTQTHVLIVCAVECSSEPFSWKHWALSASGPIHNNKSFCDDPSRI